MLTSGKIEQVGHSTTFVHTLHGCKVIKLKKTGNARFNQEVNLVLSLRG